MSKKKFIPLEWLEQPDNTQDIPSSKAPVEAKPKSFPEPQSNADDVENIIQEIEARQTDIAPAYSDWRDIGFAFASEYGESGRDYFHRISRFHTDYNTTECDKQYTHCLKANGQGITLKTFFFHAKQSGIPIGNAAFTPFPSETDSKSPLGI